MSNLHTIANELLDEIASYLGPSDTSSFLITCRSLYFRLEPAMIRHALAPKSGIHPLHWAADGGFLPLVKFLVTRFPVDHVNATGSTPLHSAVWTRRLVVADFLLLQGADVNHVDRCGLTPLHYVCHNIRTTNSAEATVRLLLAGGADVHIQGRTPPCVPLAVAIHAGLLGVARILLDAGADPNWVNIHGEPLALTAARDGKKEVLELLLDFGADINGSNHHQSNPLLITAQYGNLAIVQLLVERGANLDCMDNDGDTPLILAIVCQHQEIAEYLIGREGVDIARANRLGDSPLTLAALVGYDTVLRRLLEVGQLDVNYVDGRGYTALHLAVFNGWPGVVMTLLTNGANIEVVDSHNVTPLVTAIETKNLPIAKILIDHGANPSNHGVGASPPLTVACREGFVETVVLLLGLGVDINCKDYAGVTAMEQAVMQGDSVVIELLAAYSLGA